TTGAGPDDRRTESGAAGRAARGAGAWTGVARASEAIAARRSRAGGGHSQQERQSALETRAWSTTRREVSRVSITGFPPVPAWSVHKADVEDGRGSNAIPSNLIVLVGLSVADVTREC